MKELEQLKGDKEKQEGEAGQGTTDASSVVSLGGEELSRNPVFTESDFAALVQKARDDPYFPDPQNLDPFDSCMKELEQLKGDKEKQEGEAGQGTTDASSVVSLGGEELPVFSEPDFAAWFQKARALLADPQCNPLLEKAPELGFDLMDSDTPRKLPADEP